MLNICGISEFLPTTPQADDLDDYSTINIREKNLGSYDIKKGTDKY
jgi:hypothetical protein